MKNRFRTTMPGIALVFTLAYSPAALATTYTWDPSLTSTGSDEAGTWDTSSAVWSTGSADIAWPNLSTDTAAFGLISNTTANRLVTVNQAPSGVTANNITINSMGTNGSYKIEGTGANGTINASVTAPLIIGLSQGGGSSTINAPIAGAFDSGYGVLFKRVTTSAPPTLVFGTDSNSTFVPNTNPGILIADVNLSVKTLNTHTTVGTSTNQPGSSLGAINTTTPENNTIQLVNAAAFATLIYTGTGEGSDRPFAIGGSTARIQNDGTGPLVLAGAFKGVGSSNGNNGLPYGIVGLQGTNTGANEVSGAITDIGFPLSLVKSAAGAWTLSSANTYRGPTVVSQGTLNVSSVNNVATPLASSSLGRPTTVGDGTISIGQTSGATPARLVYTGTANETTDRVINLSGTTGGATIDQSGTSALEFTSDLTALGVGAKTLTLQGSTAGTGEISGAIANNTNGATTVSGTPAAGVTTLTLASVTGIDVGATISGIYIPPGTTVTSVSGNDVTLSNPTTGVINSSAVTFSSATINNATGVTKAGSGTWTLSGASTYTGITTVSGGTLAFSNAGAVSVANSLGKSTAAAASLRLGNGTALQYTGPGGTTDRLFTVNGTATGHSTTLDASGIGAIVFNNSGSIAYGTNNQTRTLNLAGTNTGANTLAAAITNNGTGAVSLIKSGTGSWTLSGTSVFTGGTTIRTGTLVATSNAAFGTGAVTLVDSLSGTSDNVSLLTTGAVTLANNLNSHIWSNAGGVNTIGGTTADNSVFSGLLKIDKTVKMTAASGGTVTFSGVISQAFSPGGGINKVGAGTVILTNTNTYNGPTTVSQGTLALQASATINSSSSLSIAAGAELDVTAKTAYTLPAVLSLGVDSSGTSGLIDATGKNLDISGAAVTFNVTGGLSAPVYVLATYGTKSGAAFASATPPAGYTLNYTYNSGTQIALVQTVTDFTTWIGGFTFTPGADLSATGDPDADGVNNRQEYAFGLIPNSGSSVNPITVQLDKTTGLFTYTRRKLSFTGLAYTFQYSTLLGTWVDFTPVSTTSNSGDPVEAINVAVPGSLLTNDKLFVRVLAQ